MQKSNIGPQILAATSASLILLCNGFHYGWPTPTIPKLFNDEYVDISFESNQISWMVSLLMIGCIGGAILGLFLVNICGRRTTLLLMTIPFVISCILIAFAKSYWWFYLARFGAGIASGVAFVVTPMYIGEIAETRIRGSLCMLMPIMMNLGVLVALGIGPFVDIATLIIIGAVIPIVFATVFFWVPESPYYYAMKRIPNETKKSVAWLRGTPDVVQEVEQIQNSVTLNQRRGANFLNLFTVSGNRKAFLVIIGLFTLQHLSSYVEILFFFSKILDISESKISYSTWNIILELVKLVTSIPIIFLADKVGRRTLLLISASFCTFFTLTMALCEQLVDRASEGTIIWFLPLVAMIGFSISSTVGIRTLPIVVAAEIFSCEVKAFGLAISTAWRSITIFGFGHITFLLMSLPISFHAFFYIMVASHIAIILFVYFVVPETKGRSLNEIQTVLHGKFNTRI